MTHEEILNDLMPQISKLEDIRTGPEHPADVIDETIAAFQGFTAFSLVSRDPPK